MLNSNGGRSMLDYALAYAQRDLRVFPLHAVHGGDCSCGRDACSSVGKHPRTKNGVKDATSAVEQIQHWWASWPEANIGIATGNGLYVIDVDCAKGGSYQSLASLGVESLNWTLTARTGSGGYHFYLLCSEPLNNTAGKLGPCIDTRGEGGYVVAPPSHNRHGSYTWYANRAMQALPAGVLARLKVPRLPSAGSTTSYPGYTLEQEQTLYAQTPNAAQNAASDVAPADASAHTPQPASGALVAPASVVQEARNNYLVSMAGRLRGQGLNAHEVRALLIALNQVRYGAGRHPQGPLALDEMERTIFKSLVRWEQECGVPLSTVPNVDSLSNLMGSVIPEPAWLVPGLLSEGLVLLAGKPKLGKSWLALALALTCALGSSEQGGLALGRYPVEPTGVLYLSLEDSPNRFQSRVSKLLNGRAAPERFGFALSWQPLLASGLLDLDTALSSAPDTRLVVIDTLARVRTSSTSNNSVYQDEYALMAALHELAVRHHTTLIVVHHTRKMSSSDTFDEISGSTGLTGAADTSIVLKRERGQANATLHVTGRDVEEQELALTFDSATCTWSVTGNVAEREISQSRQHVLDLLEQNETMTLGEIVKALEKPYGATKTLLCRMVQEHAIVKQGRGHYALSDSLPVQQSQENTEA